jgi:hypothetical protein
VFAFSPPPAGLAVAEFEPLAVVVVVVAGVAVTPVVLPGMRLALVIVVGAAAGFPAASRAR